jgi:hypothetical protein
VDPYPFKMEITCPSCQRKVKIEGAPQMAVALYARRYLRLGCEDCQGSGRTVWDNVDQEPAEDPQAR